MPRLLGCPHPPTLSRRRRMGFRSGNRKHGGPEEESGTGKSPAHGAFRPGRHDLAAGPPIRPVVPFSPEVLDEYEEWLVRQLFAQTQGSGLALSRTDVRKAVDEALYLPEFYPAADVVRAMASGDMWFKTFESANRGLDSDVVCPAERRRRLRSAKDPAAAGILSPCRDRHSRLGSTARHVGNQLCGRATSGAGSRQQRMTERRMPSPGRFLFFALIAAVLPPIARAAAAQAQDWTTEAEFEIGSRPGAGDTLARWPGARESRCLPLLRDRAPGIRGRNRPRPAGHRLVARWVATRGNRTARRGRRFRGSFRDPTRAPRLPDRVRVGLRAVFGRWFAHGDDRGPGNGDGSQSR